MPLPIAHPAAILPLRRFCPNRLAFAGLVVGSLVPDFAYAVPWPNLGGFSHSWLGSVGFGVPVGTAVLWFFCWIRESLARTLPEPHRSVLVPLAARPWPSLITVIPSILIGAWSHLLWDAFTHRHGWLVQHAPWLAREVVLPGGNALSTDRVLWVLSSLVGAATLVIVYWRFLERTTGSRRLLQAGQARNLAGWCLGLVAPAVVALWFARRELVDAPSFLGSYKRYAHEFAEVYLISLGILLAAVGTALRVQRGRRLAGASRSPSVP